MPRFPRFPPPHWSPEQRSALVFAGVLGLALLALSFPEMPPQALQGILWSGAGLLMLLLPPTTRLPRLWWLLAGGFLAFSLAGFLPRNPAGFPAWRTDLEALGLDTGPLAIVQPIAAAEVLAGFAVTALVTLFMLGHRVGSHGQQRLVVAFTAGVGVWTALALARHQPETEMIFGFFPNRNHTACLLAMGVLVALGGLAHGIDRRRASVIAATLPPLLLFLYALVAVSESRAGVLLLAVGLGAWLPLVGGRYFRGNAGKALLLLGFGVAGLFAIADSKVKNRLSAGLTEIGDALGSGSGAPAEVADAAASPWQEGRIAIYRDTWRMIRGESWTGVGPGQFARVFPQYRESLKVSSETPCLHPDSDWLMMVAENGWPAAACLAAGTLAVLGSAFAAARGVHGHGRALRMGCLVGGSMLVLHGVFDVPGHRVGLAWSAALLVAISLRPRGETSGPAAAGPAWRIAGLALLAGGGWLLHAEWTGRPALPSVVAAREMQAMEELQQADQAAARAAREAGQAYQPPPALDPLQSALAHVERALALAPLDPHPHFVRGALALHYDGMEPMADESFAIQRHLFPQQIDPVLAQARAWRGRDPAKVRALWSEALQRARADEQRFYWSQFSTAKTYARILGDAAGDERLVGIAQDLARGDPALHAMWVQVNGARR